MPFRIFVAEDNELIRSVVCALLTAHPGWEVCGEASDGEEALQKISEIKPDLVLLDFEMPGKSGVEVTRELLQGWNAYKVIVLTETESEPIAREIFDAGARGFLTKARATQDLTLAVQTVCNNRTFFGARFAESILKGRMGSDGKAASMADWQRESVRRLALELATNYRHHWPGTNLRHPLRKYAITFLFVAASAAVGWITYQGQWDRILPQLKEMTVKAGLNPPPPPLAARGNPDRKVWIDVHTAQYYCPGSTLYGRTRRGRVATQADAQRDHYEPAGMKACD